MKNQNESLERYLRDSLALMSVVELAVLKAEPDFNNDGVLVHCQIDKELMIINIDNNGKVAKL